MTYENEKENKEMFSSPSIANKCERCSSICVRLYYAVSGQYYGKNVCWECLDKG